MVEVRARCGEERCRGWVRLSAGGGAGPCDACGAVRNPCLDPALASGGRVEICPACGGREFFTRRDFPQRLGLAVVVVAALVACICFYFQRLVWGWGVLAAAVLIDTIAALLVGRVTVCYRCRAEIRGAGYNPDHGPFDLATSEKYG